MSQGFFTSIFRPVKWISLLSFLTKGDKILFVILLVTSFASLSFTRFFRDIGREVIVEVDGVRVARLDLFENQTIQVHGPIGKTVIEVKASKVRVVSSACPHKICVKTGPVNHAGDTIICVPNKVVVRVLGKNKKQLDVITG